MSGLTQWLLNRPPATIEKLKRINRAATSSSHIILALSYGLQDPHIRGLNKMIVGLLLARHRARRHGNTRMERRIEEKLQDMHHAINFITGTVIDVCAKKDLNNVCKRPAITSH